MAILQRSVFVFALLAVVLHSSHGAATTHAPPHTSQHPTTHHASQHPTTHHASQHPTTHHASQHPTTYHASQHPTTHHASQHPTTHHANQHPTTHHNNPHPTTHHNNPHPTTHHNNPHPTTHHNNPHPTTHHASQHPTTHHNNQHPTTHHASQHPTTHHNNQHPTTHHVPATQKPATDQRVHELEQITEQLSRQLMLQQLYVEERTRSEGDSGIKQIRVRNDGSKSYFSAGWANLNSMAAIHDHTDHIHTVGLGEFIAVLNGLEFRTRHNDYKLVKPAPKGHAYDATVDIAYPDVPPAVKSKHNITAQIVELREWFKAWRDGNHTHRDYRPYFPSLLCYLEGAWTTDTNNINEPFDSARHHLDASSWFDLQEKIRFTSYTGDKSNKQNFAYLPTTIINVTNGEPVFAQWNYRILCHPTKSYVERKELQIVDNLAVRVAKKKSFDEYKSQRSARYVVGQPPYNDHKYRHSRLDQLMEEIPGKDGYGAWHSGEVFGMQKYQLKQKASEPDKLLNTAHYHRWYRVMEKGAMGETQAHRGFADRNLFVAVTYKPEVAAMSAKYDCHNVQHPHQPTRRECKTSTQRVSFAIPLEIVYLTPINSWNPYNIEYKGDYRHSMIKANGRNGNNNPREALNGTDSKNYYLTPAAFFTGHDIDRDAADTAKGTAGVLDRHGNFHSLKASGMRTILPYIPDVGVMRTRFPIMPVYAEGSPIWKELEALRDVVMDMKDNLKYFRVDPAQAFNHNAHDSPDGSDDTEVGIPSTFMTSPSNPDPVGLHLHTIHLSEMEYKQLTEGNLVLTVSTSEDNGHSHLLEIRYDKPTGKIHIVTCDSKAQCEDGHSPVLEREEDNIHMV